MACSREVASCREAVVAFLCPSSLGEACEDHVHEHVKGWAAYPEVVVSILAEA